MALSLEGQKRQDNLDHDGRILNVELKSLAAQLLLVLGKP
jgi:hypothetical protein